MCTFLGGQGFAELPSDFGGDGGRKLGVLTLLGFGDPGEHHECFALDVVGDTDRGGLDDLVDAVDDGFDFRRAQSFSGDLEGVVAAAAHVPTVVVIDLDPVAGGTRCRPTGSSKCCSSGRGWPRRSAASPGTAVGGPVHRVRG